MVGSPVDDAGVAPSSFDAVSTELCPAQPQQKLLMQTDISKVNDFELLIILTPVIQMANAVLIHGDNARLLLQVELPSPTN